MTVTLLVIAKEPLPGRAKTRLVPPLTYEQAADVARAALTDTLRAVAATSWAERVLVLDGAPGDWLEPGWRIVPQVSGGLDLRLAAAFGAVDPRRPALLVGMDTPQLHSRQLTAFDPERYDACLGPAEDGGYWAIGFRDPRAAAAVIPGVPMSRGDTGAVQLDRLRAHGLRVQLLDTLADVDTHDTAVRVAGTLPGSGFAAAVHGARAAR